MFGITWRRNGRGMRSFSYYILINFFPKMVTFQVGMRFSIKVCVLSGQLKFSEVDDVKLLVVKGN